MICRDCKEPFVSRPNKPGYINQCEDCAEDVELSVAGPIRPAKAEELDATDFQITTRRVLGRYDEQYAPVDVVLAGEDE